MICIGCAARFESPLCVGCRAGLREGPQFVLDGAVLVTAGLHHHGVARRIVHRLKYDGLGVAADVLAVAMATRLPAATTALVPLPRALVRRLRFGIDPSAELARAVHRISGVPVVAALRPALYWPRHATRSPSGRAPARFVAVAHVPPGAVLIDDVVTSGATVRAARDALIRAGMDGVHAVVAATSPGKVPDAPGGAPAGVVTGLGPAGCARGVPSS
jgi:predicted amidophosphoribosyltransferase